MGIRSRIKKVVLPIIGRGTPERPVQDARPRSAPPSRAWEEEEEERSPRGEQPVKAYIEEVVAKHDIVLFMKGNPKAPQCGFSASAAGILMSHGHDFHTVDVILDPEVRSGVKEFSDWPTIPQVFIGGEFMGGSDILREMHDNGELKQMIAELQAGAEGAAEETEAEQE